MSAEYDPTNQGHAWGEDDEGYEDTDGIQQSANTDHSAFSLDQAPHASGDMPSNDGVLGDVGHYDPSRLTSGTPQIVESRSDMNPSPQPTSKKPKTAGGFLVADSDSEDDDSTPTAAAPRSEGNLWRSSPLRQSMTADESKATKAPGQVTISAPDRIAFLEGRVRDDPRGAIDDWVNLITEQQTTGKIDETRAIYERFFVIFPQAVSISPNPRSSVSQLTMCNIRLRCGLLTSTWNWLRTTLLKQNESLACVS
jgi:cleavage stimulation factor subunit 3